jgi:transglutaminase-like putative cysteine protease
MSRGLQEFLQPTRLCDFHVCEAIVEIAVSLTGGCPDDIARFYRLHDFVKELPYGLEDWDVKASETLRKGWGMCCGKSNLLVALARSLSIPARYSVFKIVSEHKLLGWMMGHDTELSGRLADLPPEQDHVQCEAYLDGWQLFDPSRDSRLENGLRRLNVPLERVPVVGRDGVPHFTKLSSIDEWAVRRQENRRFRDDRQMVFARANVQLAWIRELAVAP